MKLQIKTNTDKINKHLKSHDKDPFVQEKMEKGREILKILKNPIF